MLGRNKGILYCIVLYCIVLYCIVLYCILSPYFDCVDTSILLCQTHIVAKNRESVVELFQIISFNTWLAPLTLQKCYFQKKKWVNEVIKMPLLHDVPRV